MKNLMKKVITDIPLLHEDWNFDKCPDQELFACAFYEYARNSEYWLNKISAERKLPTWKGVVKELKTLTKNFDDLPWNDQIQRGGKAHINFFRLFPEYPSVPWLKIPPEKRSERIKLLAKGFEFKCPPICPTSVEELRHKDEYESMVIYVNNTYYARVALCEVRPFSICWKYSDADILAAFEQMLPKLRGSTAPVKRRGRSQCRPVVLRAKLRELGAARLLKYLSANAALIYTEQQTKQSLYTTIRSWRRAKHNAEQLLSLFVGKGFPLIDETEYDDPLALLLGPHFIEVIEDMTPE